MAIATLIAAGRLDDRQVDRALGLLRELDPAARFGRWIDDRDAADIVAAADAKATYWALHSLSDIDVVVQDDDHPRLRRLLVADMDSTMIGQECIDELADYAGVKAEIAAITERAMLGRLDFADALRERVALLAGLEEAAIDRCLVERVTPNPGARILVRTMAERGCRTLLVTGGFESFAGPVARDLGFDRVRANRLAIAEKRLTGMVEGPIVDAQAKRQALIEARAELDLSKADVIAVGDGANDLPMIAEAGLGIAYHAKPALAEAADARIDHHGLEALLWVQGISRRDWADA